MRITRLFVLLALAALLAPRAEASRTGVWARTPHSSLTASDAAGLLASLAPAAAADAETTEPPLFNLGDVVLVDTADADEESFNLGSLTLVDLNPLRGPPPSYPETRVGGFELLPPFRVGASPSLSLWGRQACGFSCREVVPDSRYDPWGLYSWSELADDLSTFYDSKAGRAVKAVGKGAALVAGGALVGVGAVAAAPVVALGLGASSATAGVVGSITATAVTAGGFGVATHQVTSAAISRHEEQLSRGENSPGRAFGLGLSDAIGATGIAEGLTGLEVDSGRQLTPQEAGDRLGEGAVRGASTALLAGAATKIGSSRAQDPRALYARAPTRKPVERAAFATAPKSPSGATVCEGCGTTFPKSIRLGSRTVRGFQMDHFNLTWADRIRIWSQRPVWPTRGEVLGNNNVGVRPLCAPCNLGHGLEGRSGPFATGLNPGLSAIPQLEGANGAVIAIGGGQYGTEQP